MLGVRNFFKKEWVSADRLVVFIFFLLLLFIGTLVYFNFYLVENLRLSMIDNQKRKNLEKIKLGIELYINSTNNCPKTSNPEPGTYLPALIVEDGYLKGGVSVLSLDESKKYLENYVSASDARGYLVGIMDNKIYIYTNEIKLPGKEDSNGITSLYTYIETSLCSVAN